jgi:hypothetical protein
METMRDTGVAETLTTDYYRVGGPLIDRFLVSWSGIISVGIVRYRHGAVKDIDCDANEKTMKERMERWGSCK